MSRFSSKYLSDEEILRIRMHFGDPRAEFDLLSPESVPTQPEWVKLVAKYKSKTAVKCMRPACGQPHNEGAIVEIKTSNQVTGLINIGHDCGEQLFPEEYIVGGTRYDTDLDRRQLIIRKRRILSKEPDIKRWFEMARKPFQDYDNARREFEAFFPDLLEIIRQAFRSGDGALVICSKPGKAFIETLRVEHIQTRVDIGWSTIHRVRGRHFYEKGELLSRAERAALECGELIERLRPDNLSIAEMRECLDSLGKIGERMEKMVWQHRDMFAALSPENLRGLAEWGRLSDPQCPYEYKDKGLYRYADGGLPEHLLKSITEVESEPMTMFPISQAA